jgi:hypothetical protein
MVEMIEFSDIEGNSVRILRNYRKYENEMNNKELRKYCKRKRTK